MEPETRFDILVAGEVNVDLILTGDVIPAFNQVEKLVDNAALTIGSSSAIFACGAARLGLKVAFIGVCGDDVFGKFMLDEMSKRNVDIGNVIIRPNETTGFSVILNQNSDRAILTYSGVIAELQAVHISDNLLRDSKHLHVASYFLQTKLQPDLPNLFDRAHSLGLTISLDTNYDPSEQWLGVDELLSGTDVFLPNQTEALCVTQLSDVETAARQLAEKVKLVVVKLGANGALAYGSHRPDGEGVGMREIVRATSIPVSVVDTIGAGDSFDAGFIYGYLNNWQIQKSLRLACVCGAMSTQQAGGTNGQPTFEEAMKYVSG